MTQLDRKKRRRAIASYVRNRGPTEESVRGAAKEFGAREGFVRACCGEFGVRLPDRRRGKPPTVTVTKITAVLTGTTLSLSAIARKYKVSRSYVSKIYLQCRSRRIAVGLRRKCGASKS